MTLGWMLLLIVALVVVNLWMMRRNKKILPKKALRTVKQQKTAEGGVTGTIVSGSSTDASRVKQVDTDHRSPSDGDSDGSGGSAD